MGCRRRKKDRALYLTDSTVRLWRETCRRAKVLADRPGDIDADRVLREACELLWRVQHREAERKRVDLALPSEATESALPTERAGFRGPPRPPQY